MAGRVGSLWALGGGSDLPWSGLWSGSPLWGEPVPFTGQSVDDLDGVPRRGRCWAEGGGEQHLHEGSDGDEPLRFQGPARGHSFPLAGCVSIQAGSVPRRPGAHPLVLIKTVRAGAMGPVPSGVLGPSLASMAACVWSVSRHMCAHTACACPRGPSPPPASPVVSSSSTSCLFLAPIPRAADTEGSAALPLGLFLGEYFMPGGGPVHRVPHPRSCRHFPG